MPRSSIRRLFNAANALTAAGVDVYRLDIGDPNFDLPQRIAEGITAALADKQTHYSPMPGIPALREAIAKHMLARFGINAAPELIVCQQGATQGLNAALQLTCDHAASIMLPQIYWPNYIQQTTLGGVRPLFYPLDKSFVPIASELERAWEPSVRAILVNSPGNPTGALFPAQVMRAIYDFACSRGLWIISDEAYCDYIYEGEPLSPIILDQERPAPERRVLGLFSFSKSYAATGLRMAYTVAPNVETAAVLGLLNEPLTGSLTTPLQWGMVRALEVEDGHERCAALRGRWQMAGDILRQSGFEAQAPQGGLFYFIDISSTGLTADSFADQLLAEQHVAVVPGSGFGLQPEVLSGGRLHFTPHSLANVCVRICFAVPEERLREGITRLAAFIAAHRVS
jgi:aspartate/methionine/tyrosine aminotransferase